MTHHFSADRSRSAVSRRAALAALAGTSLAAAPLIGRAQANFPNRAVTIVVPNAPGGAIDILARLLEKKLNETWGQPVVVVYKAGANTTLGTDYVAKQPPDGYNICLVVTSHVINPSLRKTMPFDTVKDLAGLSLLATSPILISAYPGLPANNLKEVIALAKKEPGKLTYASPGSGSSMHLGGELLKTTAGIDMLHAPYKGSGPAFPDVFAGRVELMIDPLFSSLPHIKAGKMKPIAIMSPTRSAIAPDIPTAAETLPGFVVESMFGAVVAAGTPREIINKLSRDLVATVQNPEVKARMDEVGLTAAGTSPQEFDKYIVAEIDKWAKVVKASGATAD